MVNIKLVFFGEFFGLKDINLNKSTIEDWKSKLFKISTPIEQFELLGSPDLDNWGYSDGQWRQLIPDVEGFDFTFVVTNVPLHDDYFARRISQTKMVFSICEVKNYLGEQHIPIENVILRGLYAYSLLYLRLNRRLPVADEETDLTHVETKGCIFDFNASISEVVYSSNRPILCRRCEQNLRKANISLETINAVTEEIAGIKKRRYYVISDYITQHPIMAIILSTLAAFVIGLLSNLSVKPVIRGLEYVWTLI